MVSRVNLIRRPGRMAELGETSDPGQPGKGRFDSRLGGSRLCQRRAELNAPANWPCSDCFCSPSHGNRIGREPGGNARATSLFHALEFWRLCATGEGKSRLKCLRKILVS